MSDEDRIKPWVPMTNATDLKVLGKCAEECNELGAALIRCIIQGIDECEPVTGKLNRDWVEDEIADVLANIHLVRRRFKFDDLRILKRSTRKILKLERWHAMKPYDPEG